VKYVPTDLVLMTLVFTAEGRKVGIYVLPGYENTQIAVAKVAFEAAGLMAKVVSRCKLARSTLISPIWARDWSRQVRRRDVIDRRVHL